MTEKIGEGAEGRDVVTEDLDLAIEDEVVDVGRVVENAKAGTIPYGCALGQQGCGIC